MITNRAGRLHVKAFNLSGRVTGDAANITCSFSKDGGTRTNLTDTNPVEIGTTGEYVFDVTKAEANAYDLAPVAVSSTTGVEVVVLAGQRFTTPRRSTVCG